MSTDEIVQLLRCVDQTKLRKQLDKMGDRTWLIKLLQKCQRKAPKPIALQEEQYRDLDSSCGE